MLTKDIAAMIKRKGYGRSLIIAESAEPRLNSELRNDYKLKIKTCTKKKDSINKDIVDLQSLKIVVHPKCQSMLEEFRTYSYKFDKVAGKYTNVPEDTNNHLCDALRYSLQALDRNKVKSFRNGL